MSAAKVEPAGGIETDTGKGDRQARDPRDILPAEGAVEIVQGGRPPSGAGWSPLLTLIYRLSISRIKRLTTARRAPGWLRMASEIAHIPYYDCG